MPPTLPPPMDRNLAFELARVTEAAAMAAARWMGKGDRNAADAAAVQAMRFALSAVDMDGIVVIGEGVKDEAPMLYIGERVGNGMPPEVDVAVDPIDGTALLANGQPNAISAVAVAPRGSIYCPTEVVYMEKIAVGPEARDVIDITAPVRTNLRNIARARKLPVSELTVAVLDRERHKPLIDEIRAAGARIMLLPHGDVAGALMPALPEIGVDALMGVGGAPEAVLAACALKCIGGGMQCRLWPRNDEEREACRRAGLDLSRVLTLDDLVRGDDVFFSATGITDGMLLRGVRYTERGARTSTLVMRSHSGTVRHIEAQHNFAKLLPFTGPLYGPQPGVEED
jgi:fructose-1,6-bisphosphatase II